MLEEKHKQCFKCGESKPFSAFYNTCSKCKECTKAAVRLNRLNKVEYYREYDRKRSDSDTTRIINARTEAKLKYATDPEYKARIDKTKSDWIANNRIKRNAQTTLSNAIRDGKIIRPTVCSACGKTDCEIEGHHWSYLEKHWLDVMWLCTECHGKEHRKINAENRKKSDIIQSS